MFENKYFKLFANCIPVKGHKRSIICDLQRECFLFIPNDLYKILTEHTNKSIYEIKKEFNNQFDSTIDSYFNLLIENNLINFCEKDELAFFPELELQWHESSVVSNAIIEIGKESNYNLKDVFNQLDELGCCYIQLKFYNIIKKTELLDILTYLNDTTILSIECVLSNKPNFSKNDYTELFQQIPRLEKLFIYNCNEFRIESLDNPIGSIIYLKTPLSKSKLCGNIHPHYFSINIKSFSESLKYNTCLNRKISVDKKGNIKNCPFMDISYGNIKTIQLKDAVELDSFKEKWYISKDNIETCKDCEFRYICTDCRALIVKSKNLNSKPSNCPYDPYTAKGF